ncbi:hypothetical protein BDB00DRAFT_784865 [Zychaea mexicana]|uniref:uncharacterized protein n=1 Tax=Zychaea mexicana TaxID=64656 RepID=UPI0022FF1537|nr:uncharacterized protein BDB00DRAFT_784865 [Zychaea mexicana]KAI9497545.1 hypothetical protein BDB00DRAFT_784865 [Zychaea mexicana]
MRLRMLLVLFFLLVLLGILGFAPIDLQGKINDKVLHYFAFTILAICLYFLWDLSYKRNLILAGIVLYSFAIISECVQGLLPYRTFDGYDILANVLGGSTGLLSAFLIDYFFTSRQEHKRRWGGKREAEYQRALMDEMDLGEEEIESDDDRYNNHVDEERRRMLP